MYIHTFMYIYLLHNGNCVIPLFLGTQYYKLIKLKYMFIQYNIILHDNTCNRYEFQWTFNIQISHHRRSLNSYP